MNYCNMNIEQLSHEKALVEKKLEGYKKLELDLAMSRGIPNAAMIELTAELFKDIDVYSNRIGLDGTDLGTYNQGLLSGIKEAKILFSELLCINVENIIIGGNSSLNLMFDMFSQLMLHGNCDSDRPWCHEDKLKFLCPVPGYDRHFSICEYMGIEMINIPLGPNGPDMDIVEELAANDSSIKGIWCVPQYSNPTGITYSDETVKRLASMKTAAKDFRIFWDNAYNVHHLFTGTCDSLTNIFDQCTNHGNGNRVYIFTSTSKVSIPGSGISAIGASVENISDILSRMKMQTIGYDKLNMLRHAIAFPGKDAVNEHMKKVADILAPNFNITLEIMENELAGKGIASWSSPGGGYFISFDGLKNTASRIVELCEEHGVKLTPAGAPFPYRKDPDDSNIRIAPTYPSYEEMKTAAGIFTECVKMASLEILIGDKNEQ
ncbi:MAG: aminotransferase class I/II-fold pyridoxal phosphate-dependent enzyme [Clostridia bacterium]|nr:aminotransferase class I/II-fold pyridoxal phosphate-dependent enzyme [Clostridia bacterium]